MEEVLLTQKVYNSTRTSSNNLSAMELNHMLHCTITIFLSISRMSMEDGSTAESCRLAITNKTAFT